MGYDQLDVFEKDSRDLQLVNGCQTLPKDSWPGKWVFTHFLGWPIVVNESLVQSYTGQIRVRRLDSMERVPVAEKDGVLMFTTAAGATYIVDRHDEP